MTIEAQYGNIILTEFIVKVQRVERDPDLTKWPAAAGEVPLGWIEMWTGKRPPEGWVRANGAELRIVDVPDYARLIGPPRIRVHGRLLPPWSNVRARWRWALGYLRVPDMRGRALVAE